MFLQTSTSPKSCLYALAIFMSCLLSSLEASAVAVTISGSSNFSSHQNTSYSGPYVSGTSGPRYLGPDEDITINTGVTLTIDMSNHTVKSIKMGNGGGASVTLILSSNNIFTVTQGFTSNTTGAKSINFKISGTLITGGFSGSNYALVPKTGKVEMTGGSLPSGVTSFYNLSINAPGSTVTLSNNTTVANILELKSGILNAATYSLTIKFLAGTGGTAGTAPSANSFVRTSNGGSLTRDAGNGVLFPVGATNYAPVTLGLSVTRTFTVSVIDGISDINGTPVTEHVILNTWTVTSPTSVTADVLVTLGWQDESREGTGFNDAKNAVLVLEPDSTYWTALNAYTSETSNSQQNLAVNKFQNSQPYIFAVGDADGLNLLNNVVALPVEFINFTVTKQGQDLAMLNFATAWEVNNAGFEVERSTNGISWTKIGFVEGKGNSTQINNYSFPTSLTNINSQVVYYRLKQIDFNGQYEYSDVRALRLSATDAKTVNVYPNPARNKVYVSLEGVPAGEMATISVMDMSGKLILSANQLADKDNTTFEMNLDNLIKGNYIINVNSPSSYYITKLVKF